MNTLKINNKESAITIEDAWSKDINSIKDRCSNLNEKIDKNYIEFNYDLNMAKDKLNRLSDSIELTKFEQEDLKETIKKLSILAITSDIALILLAIAFIVSKINS